MDVPEGSQAKFECKVQGSPRPEVKWYRDNKEIQSNQYTSIVTSLDGSSTLHFQKVFADDMGRVTVVATNTAGVTQMSADLNIQGILVFLMPDLPGHSLVCVVCHCGCYVDKSEILISPPNKVLAVVFTLHAFL